MVLVSKIAFVWCVLNVPIIAVLYGAYFITGQIRTIRVVATVIAFLWGAFTAQVMIKQGGFSL